jgi:hypothetical protein
LTNAALHFLGGVVDLTVLDRLLLLGLLGTAPAEADLTMHRIVRKLRDDLGFSEQEHTDLGLKSEDGKVTWTDNAYVKTVEIGPKATALIAELLTKASDAKQLRAEHLHLCDVFLPDQESSDGTD